MATTLDRDRFIKVQLARARGVHFAESGPTSPESAVVVSIATQCTQLVIPNATSKLKGVFQL